MNTKLLLLAYAFPPENVSGAARPYRFYRYLREFGVSPLVITASPQDREQPDIAFVRDVPRDYPRETWQWHVERVLRKTLLPGELGLAWSRKAAAHARTLWSGQGRAAVLSTSPPLSTHLAALQIKRKLGIPWIADFRDPISASGKIARSRMNVLSMIESRIFAHADAIVANTDVACKLWGDRYPGHRGKLHVVWNGFDPDEAITAAPLPKRSFKHLVHLGDIYGGRHPGAILDSLQRLIGRGMLAPGSLRLSLIGISVEGAIPNMDVLRRLVEQGFVEFVPSRIPQSDALLISRQADALLLLQPQSETQVPAKLFEYIRIGRPVLAYIRRDSPSDRILDRSGVSYRAIYPEDALPEVDAKIMEFLALPSDPVPPSAWFAEQFDARHQAQSLSAIIDALPVHARLK